MAPSRDTLPATEILFFEGFDELDSIGPWEVLAGSGFPVRAVGLAGAGDTVRGAHGLRVGMNGTIGNQPDLLVVPGGGWVDGTTGVRRLVEEGVLSDLLRRLHDAGTIVASVCTGAMLLAEAGLLDGRPAVTNHRALDDLRDSGAVVRSEARVVDDGDILTCGGPLAGIDLALRLVERFRGESVADMAAEFLEHRRQGPLLVTER